MIMQNELCMEWAMRGETYKEWAISVISYAILNTSPQLKGSC